MSREPQTLINRHAKWNAKRGPKLNFNDQDRNPADTSTLEAKQLVPEQHCLKILLT